VGDNTKREKEVLVHHPPEKRKEKANPEKNPRHKAKFRNEINPEVKKLERERSAVESTVSVRPKNEQSKDAGRSGNTGLGYLRTVGARKERCVKTRAGSK